MYVEKNKEYKSVVRAEGHNFRHVQNENFHKLHISVERLSDIEEGRHYILLFPNTLHTAFMLCRKVNQDQKPKKAYQVDFFFKLRQCQDEAQG